MTAEGLSYMTISCLKPLWVILGLYDLFHPSAAEQEGRINATKERDKGKDKG